MIPSHRLFSRGWRAHPHQRRSYTVFRLRVAEQQTLLSVSFEMS